MWGRGLTAATEAVEVGGMKKPLPTMTAEEIRAARDILGWTQVEAAEKLGVTVSALRKWEQKSRKITGTAVILIKFYLRDHSENR